MTTPNADRKASLASADPSPEKRNRELCFVSRVHLLRTLGLGLGFFCVGSVLRLHATPAWLWVALTVNAFAWPHLAKLLAQRSVHPRRAEHCNLMVDSTLGGVWVAVMQFNLLPSVLLVTMLSVDKVNAGGLPLLVRTSALLLVGCALTSALLGFPADLATPMSVIAACMPFLVAYPLAISTVTFSLAKRVAQQNKRLAELGRTDSLTGLVNRRECFAIAEVELARHRRTGRPAVLIIMDLDRFKRINDRYGHPVGDAVLCGVAATLRACCRAIDTPARYGGDEFVIVMPDTDLRGAELAAKRIRERLDAFVVEQAPKARCTLSLGAAEANPEITDVDVWLQRADAALYEAKTAGRDRFVGAEPMPLGKTT
jgi:diguanylate cyclase